MRKTHSMSWRIPTCKFPGVFPEELQQIARGAVGDALVAFHAMPRSGAISHVQRAQLLLKVLCKLHGAEVMRLDHKDACTGLALEDELWDCGALATAWRTCKGCELEARAEFCLRGGWGVLGGGSPP